MQEIIDDLSSNPFASFLEDGWILYHGTSESYSASIESYGLGHKEGVPPYWEDVQSFIMYWKIFNLKSRDFGDLVSFSRDDEGIRAISCGETFESAARYAVVEPGGETIGLMRRAICQIAEELRNIELIKEGLHEKHGCLYRENILSGLFESEESWDAANGAFGDSFQHIKHALSILESPEILFTELDKFKSYSSPEKHPPIVYAVRILRSDISHLSIDGAGINYRGVFRPERLLARVRISEDRVIPRPPFDYKSSDSYLEDRRMWGERLG